MTTFEAVPGLYTLVLAFGLTVTGTSAALTQTVYQGGSASWNSPTGGSTTTCCRNLSIWGKHLLEWRPAKSLHSRGRGLQSVVLRV
jgi:hypothetical protein